MIQSSSSEISNTPIIFESLQPQIHLPRELLEVIFGFYLPQTLSDEYTSPTRLCLVCPAWHAIVLSWSPFWTVLKLRGKLLRSIVTDFPADDTKMLLATWLGRSRGLAISLVLEVVELNDEEGVKEVLRMESVRMRLTSLRIAVNQLRYPRVKDPVHFPPDYKLTEFPLLQTLGFSVAYPSLGIRWYGRRPLSISTLPQLLRGLLLANHNIQNLDSQGLAFHLLLSDNASITETRWSFLPITPFQWGIDLTKIKIDTLQSTSHCLAILQYCNRLRICQLGCLVWANDEPTDSFPAGIVARHLQQLSLKGNIHAEFFTSLSAPILESLTISHTHTGMQHNFDADFSQPEAHLLQTLPSFLQRSTCPLEELNLIEIAFDAASFKHSLSSAPGLKSLVVQHQKPVIPNRASVVDILTPLIFSPILATICPNLRLLHFQSTEVPPEGLLSRLASSRMGDEAPSNGVVMLESINFKFEAPIHGSDLASLQRLCQDLVTTGNHSQCNWSFSDSATD